MWHKMNCCLALQEFPHKYFTIALICKLILGQYSLNSESDWSVIVRGRKNKRKLTKIGIDSARGMRDRSLFFPSRSLLKGRWQSWLMNHITISGSTKPPTWSGVLPCPMTKMNHTSGDSLSWIRKRRRCLRHSASVNLMAYMNSRDFLVHFSITFVSTLFYHIQKGLHHFA